MWIANQTYRLFKLFLIILTFMILPSFAQAAVFQALSGLAVNTSPANGTTPTIAISNVTGSDIPASQLVITFCLQQQFQRIASVWGAPWLDWQPSSLVSSASCASGSVAYQYAIHASLSGNVFKSGQTIQFQYSPDPWSSVLEATSVKLYTQDAAPQPPVVNNGELDIVLPVNSPAGVTSPAQVTVTGPSYPNGNSYSVAWGHPLAITQLASGSYQITAQEFKSSTYDYVAAFTPANMVNVNNNVVNVTVVYNSVPLPPPSSGSCLNGQLSVSDPKNIWSTQATLNIKNNCGVAVPLNKAVVSFQSNTDQLNQNMWGWPYGSQNFTNSGNVASAVLTNASDPLAAGQAASLFFTIPLKGSVFDLATANATLTVTPNGTPPAPPQVGTLSIQMPAAPETGVAAPLVMVSGPGFSPAESIQTQWGVAINVCPASNPSCSGVTPGSYSLTAPSVYSANNVYTSSLSSPVNVVANKTAAAIVSYMPVPLQPMSVLVKWPDGIAPASNQIVANFNNTDNHIFTKSLSAGNNTISLPQGSQYSIVTQNFSGFASTINPTSIAVGANTPVVTIQYQVSSIPVASTRFVVYWGGWSGMSYDLMKLPAAVTAVNLSFANLVNDKIDTSISGYITNVPISGGRLQPTYFNWTTYKYNHPQTKMILSLGGATFGNVWVRLASASDTDLDMIAQNIAQVVNQKYPAFSSDYANYDSARKDQLGIYLGDVVIDGIDLDVENGDSTLTPQMANATVKLIQKLQLHLATGKLITMAGFSVGADPVNSCTVPGSVHCGEDIPILTQAGGALDWVNVMAYDAGQTYATTSYQAAMSNYAGYLGKTKLTLGLGMHTQWPGFKETAAQLGAKATWQLQQGYGGVMFWGVGVDTDPAAYLQAITTGLGK